jgi:hypothetical protein
MATSKPFSRAAGRARPGTEPISDHQTWGPWVFHADTLTLCHEHEYYEIDLEDLDTCAGLLDCLFQITAKVWCSPEDAGCLIEAFRELLNPQANLCSFGQEQEFNPTAYLKKISHPSGKTS